MTTILIDLIGGDATVKDLTGIGERMIHAGPAFKEMETVLEEGEKRLFDRLGGKYIRTRNTMESLTQPNANAAIRQVHSDGGGLTFGTSIWYAHFLKKPGTKKSAVLVLEPRTRRLAKKVLLDHVIGRDTP